MPQHALLYSNEHSLCEYKTKVSSCNKIFRNIHWSQVNVNSITYALIICIHRQKDDTPWMHECIFVEQNAGNANLGCMTTFNILRRPLYWHRRIYLAKCRLEVPLATAVFAGMKLIWKYEIANRKRNTSKTFYFIFQFDLLFPTNVFVMCIQAVNI